MLSRSGERDHWQQWGLSWAAGEYRRGHADGYVLGDATGYARSDREWLAALAPARALIRDSARRPAHADAERHRWMLRGEQRTRETFGQPHPGDFPGRGGA